MTPSERIEAACSAPGFALLTTPDDLAPCQAYCECLKAEVRRLRQRHAEAVEAAFREGWLSHVADYYNNIDHGWLESEAKARLT